MAARLKSHGWQYVVVDIQWSEPHPQSHGYRPNADLVMDEYGRLIPAPNRFPSAAGHQGFRPLADYIHSKGLKFGIHIMRGIPRRAVAANLPVFGGRAHAADIADRTLDLPLEHRHVRRGHVETRRAGLLRLHSAAVRRMGSGFHQGRRHRPPVSRRRDCGPAPGHPEDRPADCPEPFSRAGRYFEGGFLRG